MNNILKNILLLFIFNRFVYYFPNLKKYKKSIKLSFYRSFLCLYFFLHSLELVLNNYKKGIKSPITYKNKNFDIITNLFISYLILDLIIIFKEKNIRLDLILHHLMCLFVFIYQKTINHCNYLIVILLMAELISVVSAIDLLSKQDKNIKLSLKLKKFRIFIINYLRIPIWLFTIFNIILHNKDCNKFEIFTGIVGQIGMLCLDFYWKNKCKKFLKKKG